MTQFNVHKEYKTTPLNLSVFYLGRCCQSEQFVCQKMKFLSDGSSILPERDWNEYRRADRQQHAKYQPHSRGNKILFVFWELSATD